MTPPVPARYLASLVAAVLLTGSPAKAFVINTNASPETDALEAAKTAAVWSANMRSLLESGERGLGGGLEYSVDPSVCTELNFVDDSSCEDIRALIAAAGAMWSLGNPNISFVDVTDILRQRAAERFPSRPAQAPKSISSPCRAQSLSKTCRDPPRRRRHFISQPNRFPRMG